MVAVLGVCATVVFVAAVVLLWRFTFLPRPRFRQKNRAAAEADEGRRRDQRRGRTGGRGDGSDRLD